MWRTLDHSQPRGGRRIVALTADDEATFAVRDADGVFRDENGDEVDVAVWAYPPVEFRRPASSR